MYTCGRDSVQFFIFGGKVMLKCRFVFWFRFQVVFYSVKNIQSFHVSALSMLYIPHIISIWVLDHILFLWRLPPYCYLVCIVSVIVLPYSFHLCFFCQIFSSSTLQDHNPRPKLSCDLPDILKNDPCFPDSVVTFYFFACLWNIYLCLS